MATKRKAGAKKPADNSVKNNGRFQAGNKYAWQSGQSGNPKGRPTRSDELAEFIRNIGTEGLEGQSEWSRLYTLVRAMYSSKNAADHIELLNRIGGKVKEEIEIDDKSLTDDERAARIAQILDEARKRQEQKI